MFICIIHLPWYLVSRVTQRWDFKGVLTIMCCFASGSLFLAMLIKTRVMAQYVFQCNTFIMISCVTQMYENHKHELLQVCWSSCIVVHLGFCFGPYFLYESYRHLCISVLYQILLQKILKLLLAKVMKLYNFVHHKCKIFKVFNLSRF